MNERPSERHGATAKNYGWCSLASRETNPFDNYP